MAEGDTKSCRIYFFEQQNREFEVFKNFNWNTYLVKWYMKDNLKLLCFSFDKKYNIEEKKQFVSNVFDSPCVRQALNIDERDFSDAITLNIEDVPCTLSKLDLFNKILTNSEIIRPNGHIVQCYDEFYDGVLVPNELRKMLIVQDSDHYESCSENDRQEFLFRIFQHFIIGGEHSQYEDIVYPYLEMTKALYKDIVCVRKDSKGQIKIKSDVFKVTCLKNNAAVFPSKKLHMQDFAYFVVDPIINKLIIFSHQWTH